MHSTLGRANSNQPTTTPRDADPAFPAEKPADDDTVTHVADPTADDVQGLSKLYSTISRADNDNTEQLHGVHEEFSEFLEKERNGKRSSGVPPRRLAVSFKDVTTWGIGGDDVRAKRFPDAVIRTLVLRDIYEWTIKAWFQKPKREECRPLIRNISGAVRDGEMML